MVLEFKEIKKVYNGGVSALDAVSTTMACGQIIGLFGENGAGKTTLLKLLSGRLFPTSGEVVVDQSDGHICMVTDRDFEKVDITVKQLFKVARPYYPSYDVDYEAKLVNTFQIPVKKRYSRLSKGERGLVCTALALASRAPVTVLDETFVSVDVGTRKLIFERLIDDYMRDNRTFILTTHHANELSPLLDHVLILSEGKLVIDATYDDVRRRAFEIKMPTDLVASLLDNKRRLHTSQFGQQSVCAIYDVLNETERRQLEARGAVISQLSLDDLILYSKRIGGTYVD